METAFRLSPLVAGQTYYLKVVVVDAANQSTISNEVSAALPTDDCNTPPVNATIETEYNLADKVVAVRDWLGVTTATYDALNRDVAITDVYGGTEGAEVYTDIVGSAKKPLFAMCRRTTALRVKSFELAS